MTKRVKVTDENFGDVLLSSAEQALEIARGARKPARVRIRERTARETVVAPPPSYDAGGVRRIRLRLRVSQTVFAGLLNVSPATVRGWERGARVPDGPSRRLLEMAERHPQAFGILAKDDVS
jgi:putative transcriptional regulator